MAEDMNQKLTGWLQPACNSRQQLVVVAHVFKHFNGNDSIKFRWSSGIDKGIKCIHVGRHHAKILQTSSFAFREDKVPLR